MKSRIAILIGTFFALTNSTLQATDCFDFTLNELSAEIGTGYREDSLTWSISFPPFADPLSVLKWKDLKIWQGALRGKAVVGSIYLRGEVDYGKIYGGKCIDSDFIGDFEFSKSISNAGKGHVADATIGLGWQFVCPLICDDVVKITPIVGYAWNQQHLQMIDGHSLFQFTFNSSEEWEERSEWHDSEIENLHSSYTAKWQGPWVGLDTEYEYEDFNFFGAIEWHWARYRASGHWNLRMEHSSTQIGDSVFVDDFRHKSCSDGLLGMLGVNYQYCEGITIGVRTRYSYYKGRKGTDRTTVKIVGILDPLTGCEIQSTKNIPFNGANWHSFYFEVNIGYKY